LDVGAFLCVVNGDEALKKVLTVEVAVFKLGGIFTKGDARLAAEREKVSLNYFG
jgi:hypothetical protein